MKPTILQGHTRPIKSIKLSIDGMHIFSASLDRTINCWDIEKKVCIKSFTHYAAINCFYLSKCGKLLISGDNTGTIYVWDIEKAQIMITLEGNPVEIINSLYLNSTNEVLLVTFSGRGKNSPSFLKCYAFKFLMNLHYKNEKEVMDKQKENEKEVLNEKMNSHSIYDINENGNLEKVKKKEKVKEEKSIETKLKLQDTKELCKFDSLNSKFVHAVYVENDKYILSIKENGFIELLNSVTGKVLVDKQVHEDVILDMDVNETMRYILTASRDGYCNLISLDTFDYIHKFNPTNPTRNINCCRLMEISNPFYCQKKVDLDKLFIDEKILSDNNDNDKFKDLRSKEKLRLAVFSGGQDSKLVTNTHKEEGGFEILAYELDTGVRLLNIESHFGPVTALGCLPYNQILISGSEDSSVRTYEIYDYIKNLEN